MSPASAGGTGVSRLERVRAVHLAARRAETLGQRFGVSRQMSLESVSAAKLMELSTRWHAESRLRPAVGGGSSRLPTQLLDHCDAGPRTPRLNCRSTLLLHWGFPPWAPRLEPASAHRSSPGRAREYRHLPCSPSFLGVHRHSLADRASPGNQDTPSNSATRSRADASAPAVSALPLKRSIIVLAMRSSTVPSAYDTHHGLT